MQTSHYDKIGDEKNDFLLLLLWMLQFFLPLLQDYGW